MIKSIIIWYSTSMTDKEIKEGIVNGNLKTFRYLYDNYFEMLRSYVTVFTKDSHVAEEIVQETFINIWEYHDKILIRDSVKSYLFKSVYNRTINYYKSKYSRKKKQTKSIDDDEQHFEIASYHFHPEIIDKLASDDLNDFLKKQIDELPLQCKTAFRLSRYDQLSNKEIAEKMNISVSTVKTYIARSLEKIREALKKF